MSPGTAQTLCQLGIALSLILTALCGYGAFYYGKQVDQSKSSDGDTKLSKQFADASVDRQKKHDKVIDTLDVINERVQPRVLSEHTIQKMEKALAHTNPISADIKVMRHDIEANELSDQIAQILRKNKWTVTISKVDVADPPIQRGMKLYFGARPSGALQAVFGAVCAQFAYAKNANIDPNVGLKTVRVYIGSK